jgi:membrane-associated phospholipid phosphatase
VNLRRRVPGRVLLPTAVLVVALLTVLVSVHWSPLFRLDRRAVKAGQPWVADRESALEVTRWVTHIGDPWVVTVISVVVALVLVLRGRLTDALLVLFIRLVAVLVSGGVKVLVDRPRPSDVPALTHVTTASFPSGHALGSAALWATVAWLVSRGRGARVGRVLALVVPILVGASRVLLGVHFPSDVVAGLLLGWLVAGATATLAERRRD